MQIYGNEVHMSQPGQGILIGGAPLAYYDPSTNIQAYNSIAYNNTVINETGDSNVGLFGMWGAKDCTFENNRGVGGQIFLAPANAGGNPPGLNINPTFRNNILQGNGGAATSPVNGWDGYWTGTCTLEGNTFSNYTSGIPT